MAWLPGNNASVLVGPPKKPRGDRLAVAPGRLPVPLTVGEVEKSELLAMKVPTPARSFAEPKALLLARMLLLRVREPLAWMPPPVAPEVVTLLLAMVQFVMVAVPVVLA